MGTPQEREKTPNQLPFSESTRQVMTFAKEEARRRNHHYIGTEHLLAGLIQKQPIKNELSKFIIDSNQIKSTIESIIGPGAIPVPVDKEIELTPRSQRVIDFASDEARNAGRQKIKPQDLLTGILIEGEGVAFGLLGRYGITLRKLRRLK